MKLDEYLWRHKISKSDFAKMCNCSRTSIRHVMEGENSYWSLIQTIERLTGGKVSYKDLETHHKNESKDKNNKDKKHSDNPTKLRAAKKGS